MIDITGVDLRKFVKEVYDLSKPQGLGFLHFKDEPLTDAEVDEIISGEGSFIRSSVALGMDYINGRSCKMTVRKAEGGRLEINDRWYDHSDAALSELLKRVGVPVPAINAS